MVYKTMEKLKFLVGGIVDVGTTYPKELIGFWLNISSWLATAAAVAALILESAKE